MPKLPKYIRLVKFNSKDRHILNTLKEYFEILPHIVYTDYKLKDGCFYYVLPNSDTICHIIWILREYLESIDTSIYSSAGYCYDSISNNALHTYIINANAWDYDALPRHVKIDPNDIEKLKCFLED